MTNVSPLLPSAADVIVVSNSRQALNAIAFIKEFGNKLKLQPFVLGLYSDANLKEKRVIAKLLDENDVSHELVRLPIGAAYFSLRRQAYILRSYRAAFSKTKPLRLFLFNYNTHYGFAYDLARQAQIPVFFIEEGLSSYKENNRYAPPRSMIQIIDRDLIMDSFFGKLLLELPYKLVKNWKRNCKKIFNFIKKEFNFLIRCVIVPFDNDYVASRLERLFSWSYYYKRFHNPVSAFDGVYGTFPDRLALRFTADEKNYYSYIKNTFEAAHAEFATKLADSGLTNRSVLYADQAYKIDKTIIIEVITKWILKEFPETDTLYIKPHPKSNFSLEKLESLRSTQPQIDIRILPYTDVPAEFIPALTACRRLVGIASTTLVYARDLCPEVETYSIYKQLLPLIEDDSRTAEVIKEHGSILEHFPGVRFV